MRTPGAKEELRKRLQIGAAIANQLPEEMSARDVAKKLGISHQAVRVTECLALAKIAARLKELGFTAADLNIDA